jgi:nucleoside-diphosphate-sugar epimerase
VNASSHVFLVGAGQVGIRLGERLVDRGIRITALRRNVEALPHAFERVAADLGAPLGSALPEADAMVITLPPPAAGYETVLTHLAEAMPAVPERVVFVSSTRVFEGLAGERPISEADDPRPTSARARDIRAGELAARRLFDALIVRPAGIYGPGRNSLVRRVRAGVPVAHARRTNRIHEHDLVRILDRMLHESAPPDVLHAVDRAPAPLGDVVRHVAARLGVPVPPDTGETDAGGTVLDGTAATALLGHYAYPDFAAGYDALIADAL